MRSLLRRWKMLQARKKAGVDEWKQAVIDRLLAEVIPPNVPYHFDSAFSFLQRARNYTRAPVRVTLFFPNYPLAIDVVGIEGRKNYLEASAYIEKVDWDRLQADLSVKLLHFQSRRCPYLVIRDIDPTDSDSLRNSVKILTGKPLKI